MSEEKILIIEDEMEMRYLLRTHLSSHFDLDEAASGEEGLRLLDQHDFSLVLLDIMMEGIDGWDVCKAIREKGLKVPIIMLTARSDVKEKVHGLNLGADDYVVKPFEPDELIARIHALLRRTEQLPDEDTETEGTFEINELKLNPNSRDVFVNDEPIELTMKEFDLLFLLASNPNWVYTRDMLLNKVWDDTRILDVRTVDSHVKHVRDKLKKTGLSFSPIKTVWGVGYKFQLPADKK
jgi:two-component system response regulator ResD